MIEVLKRDIPLEHIKQVCLRWVEDRVQGISKLVVKLFLRKSLQPAVMLFYFFSPYQDDIFVIHIENDFSSMLESMFKTEFLMTLKKRYKDKTNRELHISFLEAYVFFCCFFLCIMQDIHTCMNMPFKESFWKSCKFNINRIRQRSATCIKLVYTCYSET